MQHQLHQHFKERRLIMYGFKVKSRHSFFLLCHNSLNINVTFLERNGQTNAKPIQEINEIQRLFLINL